MERVKQTTACFINTVAPDDGALESTETRRTKIKIICINKVCQSW